MNNTEPVHEDNIAADLIDMMDAEQKAGEAATDLAENSLEQQIEAEAYEIVNMLESIVLGARKRLGQIAVTDDAWIKAAMQLKLMLSLADSTGLMSIACGFVTEQLAE